MARTSNTMLNRSLENGHPCPVSDFIQNAFDFSPLNIILAVVLSQIGFIMMSNVPSIPTLMRVFILNRC